MTIKKDILTSLSYFDIFHYPLTKGEIFKFLGSIHAYKTFEEALHELCADQWIYCFEEFYCLHNEPVLIERRKLGNARAAHILKTAGKLASFLSCFPFVRGIAVSGSLSKQFADENSDIDFFIITEKNKLWLARTFMHLFKKITYIFRMQHFFCMNYYIDEEMLQIKEKNIFTAIELITLIPFRGTKTFQNFYRQNLWTATYMPNHTSLMLPEKETSNFFIKRWIEGLFRNPFGDKLDQYLMQLTTKRWSGKTEKKRLNARGLIMSLDTSKHYSKPDPEFFQIKLLNEYKKKVSDLLSRYDESITAVLSEKAV